MIQEMLDAQRSLIRVLGQHYQLDSPQYGGRLDTVNYLLTCISNEVEEARKELPWKQWKVYKDFEFNRDSMVEETIDIFHFLLEIWIYLGVNGQEVHNTYMCKRQKNLNRWLKDGRITKEMYHVISQCGKHI